MQARLNWVLIIFGTQVIKIKQAVQPVFLDFPFPMTIDKHRKPGFQRKRRVKFKEGSGLKLTDFFVILLSQDGF